MSVDLLPLFNVFSQFSPLAVSLEVGTAGVVPAPVVLSPEVPSVSLDGTDAILTEAQAQAVRGLAESDGYWVSMLVKKFQGRPDRLVVIVGESHVKGRETANPGANAVVAFPHRGIELSRFPMRQGMPLVDNTGSTMGAALLYGLPQPHMGFVRSEARRQYLSPSINSVDGRGAIIHLRSGLYSRDIFLDAERFHFFLDGDEVLGDEAPILLEEGDAVYPALSRSIYARLRGVVVCGSVSIISLLLPCITGASNVVDCISTVSALCTFGLGASILDKLSVARPARDRHMAGRINSAVDTSADDLPWLNIVGASHVAGISKFLMDDYGFVPLQIP